MPQEPSINNRKATIGTTSSVVANQQNSGTRTFISFINTSTGGQVITIAVGEEAKAGEGIVLSPGGYYYEDTDSIVYPTQTQITAISDVAGGTLAIQERTIVQGGF